MATKKRREKRKSGNRREPRHIKLQSNERQLRWILIGMGILILVMILSYFLVQDSKKFRYAGLEFEKIKFDQLNLFYAKIAQKNQFGETVSYYNLYLRNDPRKLEININGTINLKRNLIFSIDENTMGCEDDGIAGATIGTFFKAAGIQSIIASTNESVAKERNITFATCDDSSNATVVIIKKADKTEIVQEHENCYSINFQDCDIMKAVERFIVASIANSQGIAV